VTEPARVPPSGFAPDTAPASLTAHGNETGDVIELPRPKRRGLYVLPNAITLAALFSGFYGIVMAMNGRFEAACVAIFVAAVLDSLDGRVARMTHSQSAFGEQMDSLSDMVSFGAAPALIVYIWALKDMGKVGWIPAFVYIAGAALRLARFNVNIGVVDKRFFQGLPSPAAAALVIGLVWALDDLGLRPKGVEALSWLAFAATLFAGFSMVTNAPFYSFKVVGGRRTVPFIVIAALALAIAIVALDPPRVLFALVCGYALSGYLVYAWRRSKGQRTSVIATSTDEPEEKGLHP
jgi:CDP-diacylglycerol--serine O-phosphatidyltransferase